MPTPDAITASMQFRKRLEREEAQSFARMGRLYSRIILAVADEIRRLADDIASATENAESVKKGADSTSLLVNGNRIRLARLQIILNQIEEQVTRFGGTVQSEVALAQALGIDQGARDALALMELSLPELPEDVTNAITTSFAQLPSEAIEAAAGLLEADSPLSVKLADSYGKAVRDQVERHLLEGLAFGSNPRVIARKLAKNLEGAAGLGLKWAMTTVRTAQIKSYQTANHMTYMANERIVPTWIWHAQLDERTCMSCISKHGQEFPVTETLRDHHNGRCLVPGQKIITQDGRKFVEDISVGDYVLTHKGNYKQVTSVMKRDYKGKVIELSQGRYSVTVTPEHPVLTDQGWIEAKDCKASMTLLTLNELLERASSRKTVHPSDVKALSFLASIGRFRGDLCQRGSNSTASLWAGKAKSILNVLKANWGAGRNPALFRASKKASSFSEEKLNQFSSRCLALVAALFCVTDGAQIVSFRKSGLAEIWRAIASLGVIGSILQSLINFMSDLVLIFNSAVISLYVACSSMYRRLSQVSIGSPIWASNLSSHTFDCNLPLSAGDLNRPKCLARCCTALGVLPGNIADIWDACNSQKLSSTILSSDDVHLLLPMLSSPDQYGSSIHHPLKIVKRALYCGPVYNFSVEDDESYVAGGIVVHNCAPIPKAISYTDLGLNVKTPEIKIQSGEDWFKEQPKRVQRAMMGPGKLEAWESGQFRFEDLSRPYTDDAYGELFREATLKELVG